MADASYVELIKKIKEVAKSDYDAIESIVKSENSTRTDGKIISNAFDEYIIINSDIIDHHSEEFKKIRGRKAVYVFKMIDDWSVPEDFNRFNYCAKKNNIHTTEFKKGSCLYVGKTYKAIERVHEHYAKGNSTTSSLKLEWKERKGLKESSIMFIFFLKKGLNEYHGTILPLVEENLHEYMKPLTGSSRI